MTVTQLAFQQPVAMACTDLVSLTLVLTKLQQILLLIQPDPLESLTTAGQPSPLLTVCLLQNHPSSPSDLGIPCIPEPPLPHHPLPDLSTCNVPRCELPAKFTTNAR